MPRIISLLSDPKKYGLIHYTEVGKKKKKKKDKGIS